MSNRRRRLFPQSIKSARLELTTPNRTNAVRAGLADDPDRAVQLKTAEIKHSRLAMVAFLGFAVQAGFTDSTSPLDNLNFLN